MSTLILPRGLRQKVVSEIPAEDMAWLATAEDVMRKLEMFILCQRCKMPIQGSNDETDATISVTCECRRLIYRQRADG